jgi:uncharacterized protein YebE (UPF0316 family)
VSDFNWWTALTVFVVYVFFDILYALYVICVSRQQALAASAISAVLYSLGAYGVMNYLHNPWYLIPLAVGAFIGTYIAVRYMSNFNCSKEV